MDVDWYYTNFIIGKVDFWQSHWVRHFSDYLSEYPKGFFSYRWTDQIFWHNAMGLFLKDYSKYVVDYTNLRCMPDPNCWYSSYNFQQFGQNAWHRCDNKGYFLHAKEYFIDPSDRKKADSPSNIAVWNHSISEQLFKSTYKKDCTSSAARTRK
jgi:hypothetical protein